MTQGRRWLLRLALGLPLPFPLALREYMLAGFLNQLLPGGVLGDISRAWRHAGVSRSAGQAVRAVVLERSHGARGHRPRGSPQRVMPAGRRKSNRTS